MPNIKTAYIFNLFLIIFHFLTRPKFCYTVNVILREYIDV